MENAPPFSSIDYASELNEDQLRAVTSKSRHALVLAGAGSGKTRTLTFRVAWLLEQGIPPWRILLLTFTNKAAGEMLERIEDLTGIPRNQFWGGTFHSIGQRILRANAAVLGIQPDFTILDADDAESLFASVCKQVAPEFVKGKNSPTPRVIFEAINYARNTLTPISEIAAQRLGWASRATEIVPAIFEEYTAAKREQNSCDYDDLLELLCDLLEKDPPARSRYQSRFRHILVDEFQDTNSLQSRIIRLLTGGDTHVMVVGDDAQCIYTWRGANYKNIVDFPETFEETEIHKIEINYRSTPEILDFSNSILSARTEESGFSKRLWTPNEHGQKPIFVPQLDAFAQARFVISRICSLVEDEGYALSDISVLYRAHFQAKELQIELTNHSIPFVITSGVQFFQQAHIRDFVAQLRFVQNNHDTVAFTRILSLIEKIGPRTAERTLISARKLATKTSKPLLVSLLDSTILKKIPEVARDDYTDLILTIQNMSEALFGEKMPSGAKALTDASRSATQPKQEGPPLEEIPREENSPGELFDFFANDSLSNHESEIFPVDNSESNNEPTILASPSEIVRIGIDGWYGDFLKKIYPNWQQRLDDLESMIGFAEKFETLTDLLSQLALFNSETTNKEMRVGEDEKSVIRLSTIHQAKGLEYPVVFIIGCADGLFPLGRALEEGDVDEERRLFYVACTRARERLYMLYPKISSGRNTELLSPSQFIREADPHTYNTVLGSMRNFF